MVDVQFGYGHATFVLLGNFFQDRGNHLARTTPLGPEVDQNGAIGFDYICLEAGIAQLNNLVTHLQLQSVIKALLTYQQRQ